MFFLKQPFLIELIEPNGAVRMIKLSFHVPHAPRFIRPVHDVKLN